MQGSPCWVSHVQSHKAAASKTPELGGCFSIASVRFSVRVAETGGSPHQTLHFLLVY